MSIFVAVDFGCCGKRLGGIISYPECDKTGTKGNYFAPETTDKVTPTSDTQVYKAAVKDSRIVRPEWCCSPACCQKVIDKVGDRIKGIRNMGNSANVATEAALMDEYTTTVGRHLWGCGWYIDRGLGITDWDEEQLRIDPTYLMTEAIARSVEKQLEIFKEARETAKKVFELKKDPHGTGRSYAKFGRFAEQFKQTRCAVLINPGWRDPDWPVDEIMTMAAQRGTDWRSYPHPNLSDPKAVAQRTPGQLSSATARMLALRDPKTKSRHERSLELFYIQVADYSVGDLWLIHELLRKLVTLISNQPNINAMFDPTNSQQQNYVDRRWTSQSLKIFVEGLQLGILQQKKDDNPFEYPKHCFDGLVQQVQRLCDAIALEDSILDIWVSKLSKHEQEIMNDHFAHPNKITAPPTLVPESAKEGLWPGADERSTTEPNLADLNKPHTFRKTFKPLSKHATASSMKAASAASESKKPQKANADFDFSYRQVFSRPGGPSHPSTAEGSEVSNSGKAESSSPKSSNPWLQYQIDGWSEKEAVPSVSGSEKPLKSDTTSPERPLRANREQSKGPKSRKAKSMQ